MIKRWFFGLLALGFVAANAAAQSAYVDGTDYQTLSPAVNASQDGKVVVTEYFLVRLPALFPFRTLCRTFCRRASGRARFSSRYLRR